MKKTKKKHIKRLLKEFRRINPINIELKRFNQEVYNRLIMSNGPWLDIMCENFEPFPEGMGEVLQVMTLPVPPPCAPSELLDTCWESAR